MTSRLSPEVVSRAVAGATLEWKLTDPLAFGLTTASPLQRAICRVADGVPLAGLAHDGTVIAAIKDVHGLPHERPKEMFVVSGIRTGKSLTAACSAFHMAVTCDVSALRPGEIPRVSVVSLRKDLADVIMNHLVGSVQSSPLLKAFMLGTPTADGMMVRHPSGCPVEITVVAGARAGATLVARWSAGCIFDEFPRMVGGDDAVVNWDDSRGAVIQRLLRGCQLWHIGSPSAPYGPAFEAVTEFHGHPSAQRVVVRAPARAMNPVYWTDAKCEESRLTDPDTYRTDVLAEFASPEEALFSSESIERCTRRGDVVIEPKAGNSYMAAMDPATRGNGWTMCIATREGGKTVVVRADEWVGSREAPLDPAEVLREAAEILGRYNVRTVHSDQVMGDALVSLGRQVGLHIAQWRFADRERAEKYLAIRTRVDMGEIELPAVSRLRTDLLHLRKRITPGGVSVVLPMTSDGRHCDFAPTLMLVLSRILPEPVAQSKSKMVDPETLKMREQFMKRFKRDEEW